MDTKKCGLQAQVQSKKNKTQHEGVRTPLCLYSSMELSMKLYLNDKEFEVPLQTKLTPYLHDKVTPLLNGLANSRGGNSAAEQWILEEAFSNPALAQLIDLQKGANAFDNLLATNEGQQLVKLSFLKVRQRLFEVINVDAETMPLILAFAKECIDASKVADADLLAGIQSEVTSEFWQQQDIEGMLTDLEFFRTTVCRRVRIM